MRRPIGASSRPARRAARLGLTLGIVGLVAGLAAPAGAITPAGRAAGIRPAATPVRVDESAAPSASPAEGVTTTETTCGGYTVRVVTRPFSDEVPEEPFTHASLAILAADGTVVRAWTAPDAWSSATVAWCRDLLLGEETRQLAYGIDSGGMHCCLTFFVLDMADPLREILDADLLDAGPAVPRQLDGKGPLELVADDYRLEYLGGVPFVDTHPFPRIWTYRDGRYVEATRSFPAYLRAAQKKSLRDLAALRRMPECVSDPWCLKGWGLGFVAISVLLGQPTSVISRLPLDLSLRRWLLRYRPIVAKALRPG